MPADPRLEVGALSKTFGAVRVLHDARLRVEPGEVHGLAGQNGSGKSTLIKILTGLYPPDPGARYQVDGRPIRLPVRWNEVHAAGVSVVHQDLGLLDQLSVAENICVGNFPTGRVPGLIDRRQRDRLAARTLARLGVDLDPGAPVGDLSAAQRAEVAIARALRDHASGAGLIILDESTRSLTGADLTRVHDLVRRIAADGGAAVIISHSLTELMTVTDRVTVLRDGRVAAAGIPTAALTEEDIAKYMLGSALGAMDAGPRNGTRPSTEATVTVTGLRGERVRDLDFTVGHGEILGITGVPGTGFEDIPYLLTGARPATAGHLRIDTETLSLTGVSVGRCLRAGIVLVPERRDRDGVALEVNVQDNISLPRLRHRGRPWYVARGWQRADASDAVRTLDIKPLSPSMLVKQLSGGNQQKVLLGKWLASGPRLMVLHEPTQAVDVGARQDILHALRRAADAGMAVIIVSSEPEDLAAVSDRVLLYRPGQPLTDAGADTADGLIAQIYATDIPVAGGTR